MITRRRIRSSRSAGRPPASRARSDAKLQRGLLRQVLPAGAVLVFVVGRRERQPQADQISRVLTHIERVQAKLAPRPFRRRKRMRPEDVRVAGRDDGQRRVAVQGLRRVPPRQIERSPLDDVGEQRGFAEDARLDGFEQVAISGRVEGLPVRRAPCQRVVRVVDDDRTGCADRRR